MTITLHRELDAITIETDDLDELSQLSGVLMRPLSSTTRSGGSVTRFGVGDVTVVRGHIDLVVYSEAAFPDDVYTAALKLDPPKGHWNGVPLAPGRLFVYGPRSVHKGAFGHDWASVSIPTSLFEESLERRGTRYEPPVDGRYNFVDDPRVESLGRQIDDVCSGLFAGDVVPGSQLTVDALIEAIVDIVSDSVGNERSLDGDPSRWRSVEVVRMADAFLSESGPIMSVSELAAKLDISERWMRSAFQLAVGTSPKRYLRGHQLRGSRDELLKATPETSSVTEVALNWGFWHFSRFAESYRNIYGENPSDTLHRIPSAPPQKTYYVSSR